MWLKLSVCDARYIKLNNPTFSGPNPSLQNSLRDGGRPSASDQTAPTTASDRNNKKSRRLTSSFGGNIHTLKHDEDDERFSDKNAFWNGNSTQYGGNDDGK